MLSHGGGRRCEPDRTKPPRQFTTVVVYCPVPPQPASLGAAAGAGRCARVAARATWLPRPASGRGMA
jgi:hypothetical protein